MNLKQLCALGVDELGKLAKAGKLRPSHLWTAIRGATAYRMAVVQGDIATDEEAGLRAEVCHNCPSVSWDDGMIEGVRRGWCGTPFVEGTDTCGCLVALSVFGEGIFAAGKTVVKSEECPQRKW